MHPKLGCETRIFIFGCVILHILNSAKFTHTPFRMRNITHPKLGCVISHPKSVCNVVWWHLAAVRLVLLVVRENKKTVDGLGIGVNKIALA
jgi:hypothetical protein